jgi:hypothetical protein
MGGVSAARRVAFVVGAFWALVCAAPSARAVELLDGRLQFHGYVEEVFRGIDDNFDENLDLTQWQTVFHLETEMDLLPGGVGPISGLSAYMGLDVRYDCVWTRGCGLFRSADTFGNRANKLPVRLGNARAANMSGSMQGTGAAEETPGGTPSSARFFGPTRRLGSARRIGSLRSVDGFSTLFGTPGRDAVLGTQDDPAAYVFRRFDDYRFAMRQIPGTDNGIGTQTLGPWLPMNHIDPIGSLREIANPFNPNDFNPSSGAVGSAAQPYRPSTAVQAGLNGRTTPSGLFIPSQPLSNWLRENHANEFDQNFPQRQLAWNRGASQQQTLELKELYLDAEMLDGRFFLRLGKQTIVYGKTELFTAVDQFNPRDIALSTLPSLEESRIAVWAARGIWSFYEVGPFEDVRAEIALNLDEFTPDDLGRCGEPYSPNPVCNKTYGLFAHGVSGLGIAGEERPQGWWNGWKGVQGAARLEWRWDKFSFALTDIYSYTRTPFTERMTTFSRNVDPQTGRPRRYGATGSCVTGNEPACLQGGADALANSPLNQQLFAMICATTIGFSSLDRGVCAQSVFNSQVQPLPGVTIANALSAGLGGTPGFAVAVYTALAGATQVRPVTLRDDPNDGLGAIGFGLSDTLTDEQEALLGCGNYFGQGPFGCDVRGIDLLNVEASALLQSFVGFEGTSNPWLVNDASMAQPGTIGFQGGPVCTRFVNGMTVTLPGCRGPGEVGYNPLIDGTTTGLVQPYTGQPFRSEMAAVSWNFMQLLVAFSSPDSDGPQVPGTTRFRANEINEFDEFNQNRTDGCSFIRPELCSSVQSFYSVTGIQHRDLRAGGNGRFGRRDMVWAGGGDVVLKYEKRNVLGLAMDFAEDTTKTNWAIEATWENGLPFGEADDFDGIHNTDRYNLVISADRPTFINFLNQNRTFFFNTQWFFSYVPEWRRSYDSLGPFNVLTTFTITTGYFQDRLLPGITFVYDWKSNSGAALPQIQYRFTENFSATFGAAFFMGRPQTREYPLNPLSLTNHVGRYQYVSFTEQGLSPVRDRDEVFFKLRYTF